MSNTATLVFSEKNVQAQCLCSARPEKGKSLHWPEPDQFVLHPSPLQTILTKCDQNVFLVQKGTQKNQVTVFLLQKNMTSFHA